MMSGETCDFLNSFKACEAVIEALKAKLAAGTDYEVTVKDGEMVVMMLNCSPWAQACRRAGI